MTSIEGADASGTDGPDVAANIPEVPVGPMSTPMIATGPADEGWSGTNGTVDREAAR